MVFKQTEEQNQYLCLYLHLPDGSTDLKPLLTLERHYLQMSSRNHKIGFQMKVLKKNVSLLEQWIKRDITSESFFDCLNYFQQVYDQRKTEPPKFDLISMLAHDESTNSMSPQELLGNILLLIVGGNDTTRNSISGGVLALNQNPAEYEKLIQNPGLIPKMVPEMIRWQSPVAHMARTALQDTELGGKKIKKGDRVCMWYISGNRDKDSINNADKFIIDRDNPRQHTAFGYGVHRCVGNRLAEMQLRVMWEEIMERFGKIEVKSEPKRIYSSFVKGYSELRVMLHAK